MPRVLIATDEPNFTLGLVRGYQDLGWEVLTGASNFRIRGVRCEIIHHQWPEELCGWKPPSANQIAEITATLRWWRDNAKTIFTVNNLYPHTHEANSLFHRLYTDFYEHSDVITHYSRASQALTAIEFPAAGKGNNVVHCPPNFTPTLTRQWRRGSRRSELGLSEKDFVILVLGRIRSWDEIRLIQRAFDLAEVPNKRLLFAGTLVLNEPPTSRRAKQLAWKFWLKRRRAVIESDFVPEEDISRLLDSSDITVVPRLGGLSSGVPLLAMTFGLPVIAPDHGAYPDYLAGSGNLLYETGDVRSLAAQLTRAATLDLRSIGAESHTIANGWRWTDICATCIKAAIK